METTDTFLSAQTNQGTKNPTFVSPLKSLLAKLMLPLLAVMFLAGNLAGQTYTVCSGQEYLGDLAAYDDYGSTTPPVFSLLTEPSSGTLVLNEDGNFSYTGFQAGTYSFTYQIDATTGNLIVPGAECAHAQTIQVVYLGTGANIVVVSSKITQGQGEPVEPSIFAEFENVQNGDILTIEKDHDGAPGLGLNWDFEVDGETVVTINTECGVELLGQTFGDFLVVAVDDYTLESLEPEVVSHTATATLIVLQAECPQDLAFCIDALPITLEGGTPEAGVYSGNGVSLENGNYVFDTATPGEYTITYSVAGDDCVSACEFTITVNALPIAEITPDGDLEFCEGGAVILTVSESDTYLWNTGETTRSITVIESGTFFVTVTDENDCSATSEEVTVTVHELPVVTLTPFNAVCEDVDAFVLTGGMPEGGEYFGTGVENGLFDPAVAGPGIHTITYSYTDDNECSNSASTSITVYALPVITLPDFGPVCEDADAFDLIGESPSGGTYSGTGVQGSQFVPSVAGPGTHTITYTYTDENGCTNTETVDIVVNELPVVSLAAIDPVCEDEPAFTLAGGLPEGGVYYIDGAEETTFDPASLGAATYEITYVFTDENGCTATSEEVTVTVHALPVVTCPDGMNVYENDEPFALTGAAPAGGTYYLDGNAVTTFNPATAGIGSHVITYVYSDGNGCENFCEFSINVNEAPITPFCDLQDDTFTACEGETLYGDVSDNDDYFSLGTAVFSQLTEPASGTLVFNPDGSFSYDPNEPGTFTFDYQLTIVTGEGELPTGGCDHVHTMQVLYLGDDADAVVVTSKVTPGAGNPTNPSVYEVYSDVETGDVLTITRLHDGAYGLGLNWEFRVDGTLVATINTSCGINLLGKTFGPFLVVAVDGYSLGDGAETETCTATVTLVVPGASCPDDDTVCMDQLPLTLGGATPAGGVYSGTGVSLENGSYVFDTETAGDYTITYTVESDGCEVECSYTVTVLPQPVAEITPDGDLEFCEGGSVVLTATTAEAYLWSNNETTQSITVSESGTFYVTVTDDNGCTATSEEVTVTVHELPEVTLATFDPVCEDLEAFDLTGGSPLGGTYYLGESEITGLDPAVLGAGTYEITYEYTDENGCTESASASITVLALPVVTCPEDMDVYLDDAPFTLSGAAPAGGTYYLDGNAVTTFNPATAGIGSHLITYVYTEDNGCEDFCAFFINVNEPPITPFCDLQDDNFTACEGETLYGDVSDNDEYFSLGTAVFSLVSQPASGDLVFNEDGSFSYEPDGPGTFTFDYQLTIVTGEGEVPTGLCAHVQTMQVRYLGDDADVVVVTSKVTPGAGNPTNPSVYEEYIDVETGDELTITKEHGGAAGLGLNWEFEVNGTVVATMNTSCGIDLLGKTFGPFLVIAVDDYNLETGTQTETCNATVTLVVPGASCPDDITVCMDELPIVLGGATPEGGVYAGTGVSLENGSYIFDTETAGDYTITYTVESDGCEVECSYTVTVLPQPEVSLTGTDVLCFGDDSGEIAVTITGDSAPYELSLDGETWIVAVGSEHVFENLPAGDYTVLLKDASGCLTADDMEIGEPAELLVNAGPDAEIFYGETFTMAASVDGNGPFTYDWTPVGLLEDASALNPATVALTETTTFTLTVTDANGCIASDEVTITVIGEELTVDPTASPTSICIDDSSQLLANADGGAGELTYSWTSDPEGFVSSDENPMVSPTTTTTYLLSVTDEMGTTVSGSVTVTVNPIPVIECPEYGPLCVDSGVITFTEPGVFTLDGQVVTGFDAVSPGTYSFVYTFTSEDGCSDSCEFDIVVEELPTVNCAGLSRVVCLSAGNFGLTGGNPSGGVFSGDFVANNTFNTLQAGTGVHSVTYTYTDPVTGCSNSCDFIVTVLGLADYSISKSLASINGDASLTKFSAGDVITFSIVVENTGELALQNIVITDPGTTIESGSPIPSLAAGASATVVATYVATLSDVMAGSISNTAYGEANSTYGTGGSTCGLVWATSNTVVVEAAPFGELTVTKTADVETYSLVGDVITYTIVVENTGNVVLSDVAVVDPLTDMEELIATLQPGSSQTFTEVYEVSQEDLVNGSLVNVATATGNDPNGEVITGEDSVTLTAVILTAELDITKSADVSQVNVGEQITYTLVISNNNPAAAINVVVTDELPAGVSFVSASHDGSYDEGTNMVTWNLGDLAADGSVSLTLVVEADLDVISGSVITNVAVAENDNSDFPEESNSVTVTVYTIADLMILKGADVGNVYNNQEITYTLTVTNLGPSVASNVVVHDMLPPQVEFVAASNKGSFNPNNNHVTWDLGNMNNQETVVLTVVTSVRSDVAKGTSITNFASVTSETTDPNLDNNEASATITAAGAMADLAVVKEIDVTEIMANVPFNYSIIVTNDGPSDVSNIGVVDYLPAETSFLGAGQNGTYNEASQTVNWIIDFLASGQSVTLTLTMELRSGVMGGTIVANRVSVQSDTPDPDKNNNTYVLQTPVGIPAFFIPDVFTPNNDGINDRWEIRGIEAFPNNKVVIINRWGNRVFEATGYNNDWDGTNHFSPSLGGNDLPVGTYYYILDLGPNETQRTGFIYLAR